MTGYITKGIGGFYYVKTSEGIVECKPRGIFRKQKITPVAGDVVTLETENGAAVIADIAPRRNIFVRPPMANLDVLFLVASTTQPTPSTLVLDKLSAIAVDKGVQPVIVCTKGDLAEAEFLRSAYETIDPALHPHRLRHRRGSGRHQALDQWPSLRLLRQLRRGQIHPAERPPARRGAPDRRHQPEAGPWPSHHPRGDHL